MGVSETARFRIPMAVVVGGVFASTVLACNFLIGLDDYEKVPCVGAYCLDSGLDGALVDASEPPPADAGGDADAGEGRESTYWARWKMPNYDAGADSGQPNPASYTSAGDYVSDNVTELVWRAKASADSKKFDAARAFCTGDDRLPTRIELVSLLDLSQAGAKIDPTSFPNTVPSVYWTASQSKATGEAGKRWVVNFDTGVVTTQSEQAPALVRCIKGPLTGGVQ